MDGWCAAPTLTHVIIQLINFVDTKLNALGTGTRDNMLIAMRNLLAKLAPFGGTQEKFEAWADAISRNENKLSVDFYFVWARKKQLLLSL